MEVREVSPKAKKELSLWFEQYSAIVSAKPLAVESAAQKKKNIARALKEYPFFAKRYFPHLCSSPLGWFHKKAAKEISEHTDIVALLEWAREHAKSIEADVIIPMWLKARGELTGMMVGSANFDKAAGLLIDIQVELTTNKQYIADFGEQYSLGDWKNGSFATQDGIGFWAFGAGQSPRGTRKAEKRPNYGVIDDIDTTRTVKNEKIADETLEWIMTDFYGAMSIQGSRLVIAGNRIGKKCVIAKIAGDIEPGDPVNPEICHIKVYALENPKTHKKDLSEKGVPAWKERYTRDMIINKMKRMGWRKGLKEFFHENIVEGRVFRDEHLPWAKLPPISKADMLVTYCDPSWKGTKKNDFKGVALVAKNGKYFDIYKCFLRQCTRPEMIRGHYNLGEEIPQKKTCRHYMEANFMQDTILDEYYEEGERRGKMLKIRGDYRKKPDKTDRIEDLDAFTERGLIRFNIAEKHSPDMIELRDQFLGFPDMEHDDGPDAVEGAVYMLNQRTGGGRGSGEMHMQNYTRESDRDGF